MKLWPSFNRAANALAAWREQQKAALTERQREKYRKLEQEIRDREQRDIKELAKKRQRLIEEEKRRLMARRPGLDLRMGPVRPLMEARAEYMARRTIRARQGVELRALKSQGEKALDDYLTRAQQERERGPLVKEEFREAAADRVDPQQRLDEALRARIAKRARDRGDGGRER
jgi:hypothetical protein